MNQKTASPQAEENTCSMTISSNLLSKLPVLPAFQHCVNYRAIFPTWSSPDLAVNQGLTWVTTWQLPRGAPCKPMTNCVACINALIARDCLWGLKVLFAHFQISAEAFASHVAYHWEMPESANGEMPKLFALSGNKSFLFPVSCLWSLRYTISQGPPWIRAVYTHVGLLN